MKDPDTCCVRQEAVDCGIRDNKPLALGSLIILQWMFNLCVIFNNLQTAKAGIHRMYLWFSMSSRSVFRELDIPACPVVCGGADSSLGCCPGSAEMGLETLQALVGLHQSCGSEGIMGLTVSAMAHLTLE